MTVDEIKKHCESLSVEELCYIVNNKIQYTEVIVGVAQQELRKRRPSKEEVRRFKKDRARQAKIIDGDINEDLLLWEKIIFFFVFIPRFHFLVIWDYRKRKYILKIRQTWYYIATGAGFFILFMAVGYGTIFSLKTALALWAASFLVAFAFNYYYFKARTIRRLSVQMNNPRDGT